MTIYIDPEYVTRIEDENEKLKQENERLKQELFDLYLKHYN